MLDSPNVHFSQDLEVRLGKPGMTKEGLARADAKRNDRSRLGEVSMDPVRHAGPSLIETIVKNNDSALGQSAFASVKVVLGDFSRMSAVNADKSEGAATKLQ